MSRILETALSAALALTAVLTPGISNAADLLIAKQQTFGVCSDERFLAKIVDRFDYQVHHVPNLPQVSITEFQRIHEHRYEPVDERHPIARQYCGATVVLSDGRSRDIWYLIEGRMGLAGIGDNVEFCVAGFDRWMVYNGRCRVLR